MESPFEGQGLNRYAYVRNNPVMGVDPTGFQETTPDGLSCDNHCEDPSKMDLQQQFGVPDETIIDEVNGSDTLEGQQTDALWEEIITSESAQAGDAGNLNVDLVGAPTGAPSPMVLDFRPQGPGDRYNPYDYSKFGTSLFGRPAKVTTSSRDQAGGSSLGTAHGERHPHVAGP